MRVRFNVNLGSLDAAACNKATGSKLNYKLCTEGSVVDLSDDAAEWFAKRPDFKSLFEEVTVKGEAKAPAIAGVK
jgi:hypothetical protein